MIIILIIAIIIIEFEAASEIAKEGGIIAAVVVAVCLVFGIVVAVVAMRVVRYLKRSGLIPDEWFGARSVGSFGTGEKKKTLLAVHVHDVAMHRARLQYSGHCGPAVTMVLLTDFFIYFFLAVEESSAISEMSEVRN